MTCELCKQPIVRYARRRHNGKCACHDCFLKIMANLNYTIERAETLLDEAWEGDKT